MECPALRSVDFISFSVSQGFSSKRCKPDLDVPMGSNATVSPKGTEGLSREVEPVFVTMVPEIDALLGLLSCSGLESS